MIQWKHIHQEQPKYLQYHIVLEKKTKDAALTICRYQNKLSWAETVVIYIENSIPLPDYFWCPLDAFNLPNSVLTLYKQNKAFYDATIESSAPFVVSTRKVPSTRTH